ncbi:SDR family NAD(P)-dependent oxidoreductase [Brevibacterium sp. LE-L]|uniref:SDR family NAD(P)-dependent oxidoreductase n=1 Tax=Brevibacterium sp. LE-L TaxID=3418557 RepID=UPI003CF18B90
MDLHLEGKRALITGSSSGVGRAVADRLAKEGCIVLIHGRHEQPCEDVASEIRAQGGTATIVLGDLTDPAAVVEVGERALEHGVDILVNNAGPFSEHSWDRVSPSDWIQSYQGNVVSAASLIRQLTPMMRERSWGRVINIGSRAVVSPLENMVDYSAAKAAVLNLTSSLAKSLAHSGVTANCVSPGVILTESLERMFSEREDCTAEASKDSEPDAMADYAPNPAGRLGRPEDIATAIAYLASPLAGYINGANLPVDGGITGAV